MLVPAWRTTGRRCSGLLLTVALEVARHLGYAYLHDLDQRMIIYLQRVKNLDRQWVVPS